jgi:hypothetical protein
MKHALAAITAALLTTTAAAAQSYPGDPGLGVQRGIEQLNNSGQVGSVTVFSGAMGARVLVQVHGAGRPESVRIVRGSSCENVTATPSYVLSDLHAGVSRTVVHIDESRLLSGNYNVVVFGSTAGRGPMVACGHLYAASNA